MKKFKYTFNEETGELTLFINAARVAVRLELDGRDPAERANELFRFVKFAYSEGMADMAKEAGRTINVLAGKLRLES